MTKEEWFDHVLEIGALSHVVARRFKEVQDCQDRYLDLKEQVHALSALMTVFEQKNRLLKDLMRTTKSTIDSPIPLVYAKRHGHS